MGGTTCAVRGCKNSTSKKGLSFHRIPKSSPFAAEWVKVCKNPSLVGIPTKALYTRRICSVHFRTEDYNNRYRSKSLRWNAVPSQFLPSDEAEEQLLDRSELILLQTDETSQEFLLQVKQKLEKIINQLPVPEQEETYPQLQVEQEATSSNKQQEN